MMSFLTYNKISSRYHRGFTLVEMIVAVAIFATVVLIAVGALLSIVSANRKANELRVVMENLNFAIESIARDIRTGEDYGCTGVSGDCSASSRLTFIDQSGALVEYQFQGSAIKRNIEGKSVPVTSSEVVIEDVRFYVTGASPSGDSRQPRVLMVIKGLAGIEGRNETRFNLQTTVSQRDSDKTEPSVE
jgi:prepilin-type N-terminal cleavage/methylation domain-containing protein